MPIRIAGKRTSLNLKDCIFPVRAYWDLTPAPLNAPVDHLKTCEEIVRNKVLSVDLADANIPLSKTVIEILERLSGENVTVSLTISGELLNPSTVSLLRRFNVRAVFFGVSSLEEVAATIDKMREYDRTVSDGASWRIGHRWGISFNVCKTNYRKLPEAVSVCVRNRVPRFVVPMQRLVGNRECIYVSEEERQELALKVSGVEWENGAIAIHDPFLWRVFYPGVQFPEGGCQGANSMFYISPEGDVYPCPSLPVKLGSLQDSSLKDIMLSPQKKELRERLLRPPAECLDCNEVDRCAGGCRGRAYVSSGSLNVHDPACG